MQEAFIKVKDFYTQYERYLSAGALFLGFIVDNLTLTRVDLWFDNMILFGYLAIAALGILVLNVVDSTPQVSVMGVRDSKRPFIRAASLLSMQFAFGGLFSGFVIFYTRSASFFTSWPFLLLLVALLIGNEFFRERYQRLTFQLSLFFLALFSFAIFYVPIIVKVIGPQVFMLSGVITLGIFIVFVHALRYFIADRLRRSKRSLTWSAAAIFVLINVFYFTGIIPPLPLSLKDAGIYHNVTQSGARTYEVTQEMRPWYAYFDLRKNMHVPEHRSLYAYSAVFAPTDLATHIVHSWQRYNETTDTWQEVSRIEFPIVGGRDGGYRGYTKKTNLTPGDWRVDVETEFGQVLGRISFEVIRTASLPQLETQTK